MPERRQQCLRQAANNLISDMSQPVEQTALKQIQAAGFPDWIGESQTDDTFCMERVRWTPDRRCEYKLILQDNRLCAEGVCRTLADKKGPTPPPVR